MYGPDDPGPDEPGPDEGGSGEGGSGDVFGTVGHGIADALRRELDQLRRDVFERMAGAARGGRNLALAGAFGAIAVAALGTLPIIALRRVVPAWLLAVLIGAGSGALAARFAKRGLSELGDATPLDPEKVKDAARDAVRNVAPGGA